jgi:MFS family permease
VPIYLHQNLGFSWNQLGWMFSLMLIPFILVEIPAGIVADKYIGEKEMFYAGFAIMISCLCLFSVLESNNPWLWALLLFASRVGAALVEAMRETYFFKKISASDVDKINIFRATIPFGHVLGSLLGLVILLLLPINYIFFITAILLVASFYFLSLMTDTK